MRGFGLGFIFRFSNVGSAESLPLVANLGLETGILGEKPQDMRDHKNSSQLLRERERERIAPPFCPLVVNLGRQGILERSIAGEECENRMEIEQGDRVCCPSSWCQNATSDVGSATDSTGRDTFTCQ